MSSPTPADMSLPAAVVPGLYIGDKRLAANKDVLHALGITHIVNVTHDVRHYFEHEPHSFTYLRCPCHDTDTADLYSHFTPACHFIHTALSAGHAALIHCQQGISRSAALATAYLIRHHSLTLRDAYIRVKHSRPTVKVNANFLKQLISWEKNCSSSSSNTHTQQRQHAAQQQQADTQQHRGNTTEKEAAVGRQRRRKRSEEAQEEPGADDEKKDVAGTEQKETEESVLTAAAARTDGDGERAGAAGSDGVGSSKRQRVMDVAVQPSQLPPIRVVQQTAVDGAAAKS